LKSSPIFFNVKVIVSKIYGRPLLSQNLTTPSDIGYQCSALHRCDAGAFGDLYGHRPLVNPGVVNLPTVGGAKVQALPPIFLTIGADEVITVRKEGESAQTISKLELGAFARSQAEKSAEQPVVLAADKSIKYEVVMDVMSRLKENGVKRVGLAVRSQ